MQQQVLIYKNRSMQEIEAREGRPIEVIVRELYVDQGWTLARTATKLGVVESTLSRWLVQLGITARRQGPRAGVAD